VMLASPRSRSGAIGANFRPLHLAYERRSTGGGYPGYPLFGADLHSTICESFPPRPPSTTHPPQEEINPPDLKNERRRRRGRSQATPVTPPKCTVTLQSTVSDVLTGTHRPSSLA
jgi:hypothetical protein